MSWQDGLIGQDGERHTIAYRRGRSMSIIIDDFRDDPTYVDPHQQAQWEEIDAMAIDDLKDVARWALDFMPDVSCAAIAHALGLKLHSVVAMSNGRHNKAKRKGASKEIDLAEVTREEIINQYRESFAGN